MSSKGTRGNSAPPAPVVKAHFTWLQLVIVGILFVINMLELQKYKENNKNKKQAFFAVRR